MNKKEDWVFHNTQLLLENYREVVWSLEVSVFQSSINFREEFGSTIEEFLDLSYNAGLDLPTSDVAARIQSINKSRNMLRIIDNAISILREKHKNGELYYWILYYAYLSPQETKSVEEILDKLALYAQDISRRSYFRKREEAIIELGHLLWGYSTKETNKVLEHFEL